MSLIASDKGGNDFEITPPGQYIGRCFKIVDMGTQTTTGMYGVKDQHKVMISWELLDGTKMQDGRPFAVSQFYTFSLHEKAKMRADLESWRGRKFTQEELDAFDVSTVLGAYCMLQVVHDETGKYANVQTIMSYKGDKLPAVNPNIVFDIDNPDMEVFNAFSDNMKLKITGTPEWKSNHQVAKPTPSKEAEKLDPIIEDVEEEINLDDIPF